MKAQESVEGQLELTRKMLVDDLKSYMVCGPSYEVAANG